MNESKSGCEKGENNVYLSEKIELGKEENTDMRKRRIEGKINVKKVQAQN